MADRRGVRSPEPVALNGPAVAQEEFDGLFERLRRWTPGQPVDERGATAEVTPERVRGALAVPRSGRAVSLALPLNRVAGPVHITTGRRLAAGWPEGSDDVVVMLDASLSCQVYRDEPIDIYWGAYLGTPDEILLSGPLAEVADEIARVRAEARERKGWMFDTYLLRRER